MPHTATYSQHTWGAACFIQHPGRVVRAGGVTVLMDTGGAQRQASGILQKPYELRLSEKVALPLSFQDDFIITWPIVAAEDSQARLCLSR